jgi:hypothetical protein
MRSRIGACGALVFVVLGWGSFGLAGQPPGAGTSASGWVDWFRANAGGIRAYALVTGVVVLALGLWFGALRDLVWSRERSRLTASFSSLGLALLAVCFVASGGISSAVAMRLDDLSPEVVLFASTLVGVLNAGAQLGLAALMAGISATALTTRTLPAWMAILGFVGAAAALGSGVGVAVESDAVAAAVLASWVIVSVWLLATAWVMWTAAPQRVLQLPDDALGPFAGTSATTPTYELR